MRELREKAAFREEHGFVTTLDSASVCAKADRLVGEELRKELVAGADLLRAASRGMGTRRDWHPGSEGEGVEFGPSLLVPTCIRASAGTAQWTGWATRLPGQFWQRRHRTRTEHRRGTIWTI